MKPIKGIISSLFLALAATAMGQQVDRLGLTDIDIRRSNDSTLAIGMTVNPKLCHLKRSQLVEVVPVVKSADGENMAELTPFAIAGKNQYYFNVRSGYPGEILLSGSKTTTRYHESLPWQDWMNESTVDFVVRRSTCCTPDEEEKIPVVEMDFNPPVIPVESDLQWIAPVATAVKEFALEGKAYVNFPVNKTEIYPTYMNNPAELKKITNSIDTVRDNPDAHIETITLTGYASPEGPYLNNVRLAKGRTEAVRDYVSKLYDFPASVYITASVPEDWAGLRENIEKSDLPMRDQMISFIDSDYPIEKRNDRFRELFPANYKILLKDVYPWLRHTDYLIKYTIRSYTDIEEIKEVLKTRPQNLSLNEIYLLANTYEEGSDEYNEVFETAVRLYPNDPLANINAANIAMSRNDVALAESHLLRAGDSGEANYARGMLYAKKKDYEKALEYLAKSSDPKAPAAIKKITDIQTFQGKINYLTN